jgi:hypothetical protein
MDSITLKRHKIISYTAIAWNFLGLLAFIMQVLMTDEMIKALPQAEQELYTNLPSWYIFAYGIGVLGGFIGSIALLLRKKISVALFSVSLIGILAQTIYTFFFTNTFAVYGYGSAILPIFVVVLAVFLLSYSTTLKKEGYLN